MAHYSVADVDVVEIGDGQLEIVATLVPTAVDPNEVNAVALDLQKQGGVRHATWKSAPRIGGSGTRETGTGVRRSVLKSEISEITFVSPKILMALSCCKAPYSADCRKFPNCCLPAIGIFSAPLRISRN